MNIKNLDHIKITTEDLRRMYNIELEKFNRSISLPPKQPETLFKYHKIPSGPVYDLFLRTEFFKKMRFMQEMKVPLNHFKKLHQWLQHIPDFQNVRIGDIKRINLYFVKPNPHREIEKFVGETKCKCKMPPCECNWSEMGKTPWRLAFLAQVDEGKLYEAVCTEQNAQISFSFLITIK